jgi:signal transduction histidine kinase
MELACLTSSYTYGGRIEVANEEGKGSEFRVILPVER